MRRPVRVHTLLGPQAPEIMALLVTILHRRSGSSRVVLRWLRSLDEAARS